MILKQRSTQKIMGESGCRLFPNPKSMNPLCVDCSCEIFSSNMMIDRIKNDYGKLLCCKCRERSKKLPEVRSVEIEERSDEIDKLVDDLINEQLRLIKEWTELNGRDK